jgi:GINS complex subunit 4
MDTDADISSILSSLTGPTIPPETADLQQLTRAWVTERSAPELLPWPAELVERTMARVAAQVELIEELTASMDPRSGGFGLIVLQTEMERVRFLVRNWLRARLMKVCMHMFLLFLPCFLRCVCVYIYIYIMLKNDPCF